MSERETLADIVADLRGRADCAERHGDRETHNDGVATLLRSIADRIEAIDSADTWRSLYTPGNAAAMREALLRCDAIAQLPEVRNEQSIKDMRNIVKHALSAPARQCDVGTPDEQSERMEKAVCSKHHGCVRCPLRKAKYSDCSLGWAQTPYAEEGGAA